MKIFAGLLFFSFVFLMGCNDSERNEIVDADLNKLIPGPIKHEALTEAQVSRIAAIQQIFLDVDPTPVEKWIEDFQRDQNPNNEIQIWEAIATSYAVFTADRNISLQMKKEAFGLLLMRSVSSAEETLERVELKALSTKQAQKLVDGYRLEARPITVSPIVN